MAMAKATCPHSCVTCRAIELGLDHRPLTHEEFILVQGGLVYPTPEPNGWSPETLEAALVVETVEAEYADAESVLKAAFRESERPGRVGDAERRKGELGLVRARKAIEEAGERVVEARVRHTELVRADQHRHRLERDRESLDAKEEGKRQHRAAVMRLVGRGS